MGFVAALFIIPSDVRLNHMAVFAWFAAMFTLLGAMLVRGAVMTRV